MPGTSDAHLRWHRTTLDGLTAFYGDAGDGSPVVFLHGWGLTARAYARVLPQLATSGVRVIAPALPGFGRSEPLSGPYTFERFANWVDELLEHVGVDEPAVLVGHSFGGGVATATAWHHPHRARALVLVNSVGGSVWKESRTGAQRLLADRPLWDWGLHLPSEFRKRRYRKVLPVVLRDVLTNAVANPRALMRAGELARTADLRDELAELAQRGLPVSVLWGAEDTVVPEATFLSLCEAAGSEGDIIEDAGHSWLLADPEGFGELLTNSVVHHTTLTERSPGAAAHRRDEGPDPTGASA